MKRFALTAVLTCLLCISVSAGQIPTVDTPQPPPNGSTQTMTASSGDIPSGGAVEQASDAGLSALLSLLSFLAI